MALFTYLYPIVGGLDPQGPLSEINSELKKVETSEKVRPVPLLCQGETHKWQSVQVPMQFMVVLKRSIFQNDSYFCVV